MTKLTMLSVFVFASIVSLALPGRAFAAAPQDTYTWQKNIGSCPTDSITSDLCGPFSSAIGPDGNLYVVDSNYWWGGADNIKVYTPGGVLVRTIGSHGSGNGQFSTPAGVVFDSNDLLVVDWGNNRIQKFSMDGTYLSQFGTYGTGDGQFNGPSGIALDSAGNIYVTDEHNYRVQKFDSSGNYISQFGTQGSGNGQFKDPVGVMVDSAGTVYVSDQNLKTIQKFTAGGTYIGQFGAGIGSGDGQFSYLYGMTTDASGAIYVADTGNNRIQKFDKNGNYLSQFGTTGSGDGELLDPLDVTVAADGTVYVADGDNSRISVWVPQTPPSAPQNVTATPVSPTSIQVTWQASTHTGSPPLTAYRVMFRVAGTSNWTTAAELSPATLSYTLMSLTPATHYDVQVVAVNAIGASTDSPQPGDVVKAATLSSGQSVSDLANTGANIWLYVLLGIGVLGIGVFLINRSLRRTRS